MSDKLNSVWWTLRIGLGLGAFLAGLDKFFNVLTDWGMYLSPLAERVLPVSAPVFMRAVGVIEMFAGVLLLAGFTRIGGYIVMGWLLAIAANLVSTGVFLDLAVRDVEMALAAYALARLTEARMAARASADEEMELRGLAPDRGFPSAAPVAKRLAMLTLVSLLTVPFAVAAETWKNDSHTTQCALFDAAGDEKTVAALKATKKTDHLRATVTGERDGDTIKVSSVSIE